MAKWLHNDTYAGGLTKFATANQMTACTQQPTTRTEAVTTYALASVAMSGGDFTQAAGDVSGRKVTVAAKSDVSITTTGEVTHVALVDGSTLLAVTTVASQTLTQGNTVSFGTWKWEIQAPA
jgi:hypothetical protein